MPPTNHDTDHDDQPTTNEDAARMPRTPEDFRTVHMLIDYGTGRVGLILGDADPLFLDPDDANDMADEFDALVDAGVLNAHDQETADQFADDLRDAAIAADEHDPIAAPGDAVPLDEYDDIDIDGDANHANDANDANTDDEAS